MPNSSDESADREPDSDYALPTLGALRDLLIARARAGDSEALGQLLKQHADGLLAMIARLMGADLRRTLEPEDVLQETLMVAARGFSEFIGNDGWELSAWLVTLARRKVVDLARHNGRLKRELKRQRSLDNPLSDGKGSPADRLQDDINTASQFAMKNEFEGNLQEAMAKLDPREAEALRLRYVDGMGLQSIGLKLGIGRHGASSVIARALKKLRKVLPQ